MKIDGSAVNNSTEIAAKCEKYLKAITKKRKIDLQSIGSPPNNNFLDLLRCQCKVKKECKAVEKSYMKCHSSVMGTGSFDGRKHCGEELEKLSECALGKMKISKK